MQRSQWETGVRVRLNWDWEVYQQVSDGEQACAEEWIRLAAEVRRELGYDEGQ